MNPMVWVLVATAATLAGCYAIGTMFGRVYYVSAQAHYSALASSVTFPRHILPPGTLAKIREVGKSPALGMPYGGRHEPHLGPPKPGSDEAARIGCTCARMDNNYGRGYLGQPGIFVYSGDCPVHSFLVPIGKGAGDV